MVTENIDKKSHNLKTICDGVNFPPISMFIYNSGHFYLKAVDFKIRVLGLSDVSQHLIYLTLKI